MTPEEELRRDEIGRDFAATDPPMVPVRAIAEFEEMQSVLIRYPFGIPMSLIVEMAEDCHVTTIVASTTQQNTVLNQYISAGVDTSHCAWLIAPTNSYWTRDYGPWFVADSNNQVGINDFPYNRPRPYDDNIPVVLAQDMGIPLFGMPLIHTGGNWMCDGMGMAASTDLVYTENPTLTHQEIDTLVWNYLGIEKYHVLPDPLGEYIEHIDCWGKFLDIDKVLIGQVPESDPRYDDYENVADYFAAQNSSYGTPYQVIRIYTPGDYPYTPYTNSLILNKKVFVPLTGSQWDDEAMQVYQDAMPGYEIIGVQYTSWENTDALHCRTIGIADTGMLYIHHIPLSGAQDFNLAYGLEADVIPYSGANLIGDSLCCVFSVDNGPYDTVPLQLLQGYRYRADLPLIPPQSEVAYFLSAADSSGRKRCHPYIGAPDPHIFTVSYATDAVLAPDTLVFSSVAEMMAGKGFDIYNFTAGSLDVTEVETDALDVFGWEIDPWNYSLPITMGYADTVSLNVKITPPVDNQVSDFLIDTLDITTEYGSHRVILRASATGRWKGTVSSDWNDPANWCDHTVPADTTNIFIPPGASNWPVITGDIIIGVNSGNITVVGPAELNVNGSITVNPGRELNIIGNGIVRQY